MALLSFRTRSKERDQEVDARRKEAIRSVVIKQRHAAMTELAGMRARMQTHFHRADQELSMSGEYAARAAADEAAIAASEKAGMLAMRRLDALTAELALYGELLAKLGDG